ncbi:MAG TPA: hypothetical protein VGS60_03660 [Actinomycetes bacterium]|jgi:hypothetical protein|nr:hypothetical protein [Actinomycetes bacterium]
MARYAERTTVASEQSRAEIERTLRRYGATGYAYGWHGQDASLMFELNSRRIRFVLKLADPSSALHPYS